MKHFMQHDSGSLFFRQLLEEQRVDLQIDLFTVQDDPCCLRRKIRSDVTESHQDLAIERSMSQHVRQSFADPLSRSFLRFLLFRFGQVFDFPHRVGAKTSFHPSRQGVAVHHLTTPSDGDE